MLKYILLKSAGHGLGNRLLVLSTAIQLCRRYKAKLIVDWNDGAYGPLSFWDIFQLIGCEDILCESQDTRLLNGLTSSQKAWEGRFETSIDQIYNDVSGKGEFAGVDHQEIPLISGLKTVFHGQKQSEVLVLAGYLKRGQAPLSLLRHLRISVSWSHRLSLDFRTMPEQIRNGEYAAIHVRAAAGSLFCPPDYSLLLRYLDRHPASLAFLATDTDAEIEKCRSLIGKRLFVADKSFPIRPNSHYSSEPLSLHHMDPSSSVVIQGQTIYEALRDIILLSRSEALFAQPFSTFSEVACLFSCCPPSRVFPSSRTNLKCRLGMWLRSSFKYRLSGLRSPSMLSNDCPA